MAIASVHFSGICTHVTSGAPEGEGHFVMLAEASDPCSYDRIPQLRGLPPHSAKLVVAKSTIRSATLDECEENGDTLAVRLHGNAKITIAPAGGAAEMDEQQLPPEPKPTWRSIIPRICVLSPPPDSHPRSIALGIEQRRAAWLKIGFATELTAVDHDPRTGDASLLWRFNTESGRVYVAIDQPYGGGQQLLELEVPSQPELPLQSLIRIENVGTIEDGRFDYLFHYYLLFAGVPPNAPMPNGRGLDEGGTVLGCSNSTYP
jgi:hypothetical protein